MTVLRVIGNCTIETDRVDKCRHQYQTAFLVICAFAFTFGFIAALLLSHNPDMTLPTYAAMCVALAGIMGIFFDDYILPYRCGVKVYLTEPTRQELRYYPSYEFQLSDNPVIDAQKINTYATKIEGIAVKYRDAENAEAQVNRDCCNKYQQVLERVQR